MDRYGNGWRLSAFRPSWGKVELDEDLFVHPWLCGDVGLFVIPFELRVVFAFAGIPRSRAIEGEDGVENDFGVVL
jgi:hypothetical protein